MKIKLLISLLLLTIVSLAQPTLIYKGHNKKVKEQVEKANCILQDATFYEIIASNKIFDNCQLTGREVAFFIKHCPIKVEVKYSWRMIIANASTKDSKIIRISRWHFDNSTKEGINTLIHELVHAVDWYNGELEFTHSSNDNSDGLQDYTAPWVIGLIAENLAK